MAGRGGRGRAAYCAPRERCGKCKCSHMPMQLNLRGQRMAGGKADVGTGYKSLQVHKEDHHIPVQVQVPHTGSCRFNLLLA